MRCPRCGEQMVRGHVRIHATLGTFLFYGFSRQLLWWYPKGGKRMLVLRPNTEAEAERCESCGALVLATPADI